MAEKWVIELEFSIKGNAEFVQEWLKEEFDITVPIKKVKVKS